MVPPKRKNNPFIEFARFYLQLVDGSNRPGKPEDIREIFDAITKGVLDPKDRPDGKMFRLGSVVIENSRGKILHQGVSSEPESLTSLAR